MPIFAAAVALQSFIVHREALNHIFFQSLRGPATEISCDRRFDPVAEGDDHVEVVIRQLPRNLAAALGANLSEFPTGCRFVQLAFLVDMVNVLYDV